LNVGILTGRIGTLDPHQVPCQYIAPSSYRHVLVGRKGVPLLHDSLLRDAEVGAVHGHRAIVSHVVGTQPALKHYQRLRGQRWRGCVDRYE
jgi:hypothetical protein